MYADNIGIILLAAGASHRMGQPKQLLKINVQHTLIEHIITVAQATTISKIIVVLGANAPAIQKTISEYKVPILINKTWQEGMGTSIKVGLQYLLQQSPDLKAAIISVCDQPYLTTDIFNQLIEKYTASPHLIVCARYGEKKGVPAIIDQYFFSQLLDLQADEGARKIIQNNPSLVTDIDFPEGIIDLDTPAAYLDFLKN